MWIVAVPALGGPGTSEEVVGTWVGCAEKCVLSGLGKGLCAPYLYYIVYIVHWAMGLAGSIQSMKYFLLIVQLPNANTHAMLLQGFS